MFPLRKTIVEFSNLEPAQRVLDVSTGTGSQAYYFAKSGHRVTGIDISRAMLNQANKKVTPDLELTFQEADAMNLPFKDKIFDLVTITWTLHEVPFEDGIKVLQEMKRVVKDNGRVLVMDYSQPKRSLVSKILYPILAILETSNYKEYIKNGIDSYIDEVGLNLVSEDNYLGVWQMLLLSK